MPHTSGLRVGVLAGGPALETVLIFRVAAPSRFPEGAEGLAFSLEQVYWPYN